MATINYWGLSGYKGTVTVDLAVDTFDTLINAIAVDETNSMIVYGLPVGLPTEYYTITLQRNPSIGDIVYGDSTTVLNDSSIGMVDGDTVICTPNQNGTKEYRQIQKLAIAALNRLRTGRPDTYNRDDLPTKYTENTIVDNPNVGGLVDGRPWS